MHPTHRTSPVTSFTPYHNHHIREAFAHDLPHPIHITLQEFYNLMGETSPVPADKCKPNMLCSINAFITQANCFAHKLYPQSMFDLLGRGYPSSCLYLRDLFLGQIKVLCCRSSHLHSFKTRCHCIQSQSLQPLERSISRVSSRIPGSLALYRNDRGISLFWEIFQ